MEKNLKKNIYVLYMYNIYIGLAKKVHASFSYTDF